MCLLHNLELWVTDQAKIIQQQLSTRYAEAEARHAAEIKELGNEMMLKEEEQKTATKLLEIRIGEMEADIKYIASQRDAVLKRERDANQKLDNAKEAAKKLKTSLEKKIKGKFSCFIWTLVMLKCNA